MKNEWKINFKFNLKDIKCSYLTMFSYLVTNLCNEFHDLICSSCVEKISLKEKQEKF